jgi:hypothetical protein
MSWDLSHSKSDLDFMVVFYVFSLRQGQLLLRDKELRGLLDGAADLNGDLLVLNVVVGSLSVVVDVHHNTLSIPSKNAISNFLVASVRSNLRSSSATATRRRAYDDPSQ